MYEEYLRALLAPLGVYRLDGDSLSGAELHALGKGLDGVSARLDQVERESLTETAEDEGLRRREALFLRRPASTTLKERREAIAALLQIDGDSLTPEAINRTISGCGIRARAIETGTNQVLIEFPNTAGVPQDFEQIEKIILDILPCHLEVEFRLRYLTWEICHQVGFTWAGIEEERYNWRGFQLAVPPEEEI
ncbi:putative phage tail protein [uncultured Oscillibacter sp.]|uniref:putative phage tail protein n=1 Tax=uncultured Oscillibacter sp. TaxID=876091 RepID=UPI00260FCF32|nr:hypothetical protein [uncultured Oscillibacter sp.]